MTEGLEGREEGSRGEARGGRRELEKPRRRLSPRAPGRKRPRCPADGSPGKQSSDPRPRAPRESRRVWLYAVVSSRLSPQPGTRTRRFRRRAAHSGMNKPARKRLKAEQGPGDASSLIILEGASEPWRWWPAPWYGNDRDDQPRPDRESPVQRTRGRAVRKTEWPRHPPNEQTHTHRSERKSTLFEITRRALGEAARGSAFEIGAQNPSLRGTEPVCLTNATDEGRRAGRGGGGGLGKRGWGSWEAARSLIAVNGRKGTGALLRARPLGASPRWACASSLEATVDLSGEEPKNPRAAGHWAVCWHPHHRGKVSALGAARLQPGVKQQSALGLKPPSVGFGVTCS